MLDPDSAWRACTLCTHPTQFRPRNRDNQQKYHETNAECKASSAPETNEAAASAFGKNRFGAQSKIGRQPLLTPSVKNQVRL